MRLIDGRNARPLKREVVYVRFGETAPSQAIQVETDETGTAKFSGPTQQSVLAVELGFQPERPMDSGL